MAAEQFFFSPPPPALAFQKGASLNGIAPTRLVSAIPDQCRRRRRRRQEEGKEAPSPSAQDHLAHRNRVPLVSQPLKMTLVLFPARKKVMVVFSDCLNFTAGESADGKMHLFNSIIRNSIQVCPTKIHGNEIKSHTLDALRERVNVLFH